MKRANVFSDECEYDDEDPDGYRAGAKHITRALGASALAVKVFEIPAGQSLCPYHYEYEEEWLIVLEGSVLVRTPAGEESLERGAVVAFPPGPDGAHKARNAGPEPARVLMFSSAHEPAVAVYPDSGKVGVWPGDARDELMFRRSDGGVGYYDGES